MNPLLRNSEAHLFVASLESPALAHEDEHHLDRVLRIEPTDPITICDGKGRWATATWSRTRGVTLTGEVRHQDEHPALTIACAIPKGDRPELIVQKLTELGIDRILFFESKRSVVHWDAERRSKQRERLTRIAHEAAMQSRRLFLPQVGFCTFEQAIELPDVAVAEPGATRPIDESMRTVLIGPEGGFDREELEYAVPMVTLSLHVLRVETAAIVAAAALTACHG